MTIQLGNPSTPATAGQLADISAQLRVDAQTIRNLGSPLTVHRRSGTPFLLTLNASGVGVVPPAVSVPASAVGIVLECTAGGATDYVFAALRSAGLANDNTGVAATDLSTNTQKNLGASGTAPARHVKLGESLILPFKAKGAIPAAWRFARGATGVNMNGYFLDESSNFPYLMNTDEEFLMIGTNIVVTFPTTGGAPTKMPAGTTAVMFQLINGTAVTTVPRFTVDGSDPVNGGLGQAMTAGHYLVDAARHGVALTAPKFYLPSGWFMVGYALIG